MDNFNLKHIESGSRVHFVGIGGISMSALAEILHKNGCIVTGSDISCSNITKKLENMGIKIYLGHNENNVFGSELVVYTAAVKSDNKELIYAKNNNICTIERARLLGELMRKYACPIAVSGTHGKTTTTSMLAVTLIKSGLSPTVTVGGELPEINGNLFVGNNEYFVLEACEYVDSFLSFYPKIAIITNIEEDHLDYFSGIEQIIASFNKFAKKLPKDGLLVINFDDKNAIKASENLDCKIISYSLKDKNADFYANNIAFDEFSTPYFDIYKKGEFFGKIKLSVTGIHNVYNSLSVIAVCDFLGLNKNDIITNLQSYCGTKRRFEKKGEYNGAIIIDDYAHHPTEVLATLNAAKNYKNSKVYCVFQPHTYTRTKALLCEFAKSLSVADEVIVTDIYAAREKDTGDIHSKDLVKITKNAKYFKNFDEIESYIKNSVNKGDIVITMGAGDVYKIGENITK